MATTTKNTAPKTTAKAKAKAPAKAPAKAKAKAPAKAEAKAPAKAEVKAPAKAKAPGKLETLDARVITLADKEFTFGAEGTVRRQSWEALKKTLTKGKTTVGNFKKAGGKVKYLSRWEASKAIKIAA